MIRKIINAASDVIYIVFHARLIWILFWISLIFIFATNGFPEERSADGLTNVRGINDPIYIIPDQPGSMLSFGIAVNQATLLTERSIYDPLLFVDPFEEVFFKLEKSDVSTVVRIALDEFSFFIS